MIRTLAAISRLTIRRSALRCQKMNPKISLVVDSSLVNSYKFALIHTSPLVYKKSGGSKKSKKGSSLDDLLDELSDDEDDTSAQKQPAIASINPNSPVSKFLKDQVKGILFIYKFLKSIPPSMTFVDYKNLDVYRFFNSFYS